MLTASIQNIINNVCWIFFGEIPKFLTVKEKVLAAARAGIKTVLLPERNRKDLEDVLDAVRADVRFIWLDRVEDVIAAALTQERHSASVVFSE